MRLKMNNSDLKNQILENISDFALNKSEEEILKNDLTAYMMDATVTALTLFFNGVVLACLVSNRGKVPEVIYLQLMCLCVTDLIAGSTPGMWCLTLIDSFNTSSAACLVLLAVSTAAQYAVLVNLCSLAIRRWLILRNASQPMPKTSQNSKTAIYLVVFPWILSFSVNLPLIYINATDSATVNGCVSPKIFKGQEAAVISLGLYMFTLLFLNVFYILSLCSLRHVDRSTTTTLQGRRLQLQHRAYKNILMVLMVANITTVPLFTMLALTQLGLTDPSPQTLYKVGWCLKLNSLLNPVLYSVQVCEVRAVLKEKAVSLIHCSGSMLGRN